MNKFMIGIAFVLGLLISFGIGHIHGHNKDVLEIKEISKTITAFETQDYIQKQIILDLFKIIDDNDCLNKHKRI